MKEFANTLRKKFKLDWQSIQAALEELETNFAVHPTSVVSIKDACSIAERYGFSFYDSLIVIAALEAGCSGLYSEDLQHGQIIEDVLIVKNPFVER